MTVRTNNGTAQPTPFYSLHIRHHAKIIEFAGWKMPVQYKSIIDEHRRVRTTVGLFDLCHMGEIEVWGTNAAQFIQKITTNDVSKLAVNQVHYTCMCYPHGGIVDDLLLYRFEDHFLLVVNAANRSKDLQWMSQHNEFDVQLFDRTEETALLAIQGPNAQHVLTKLTSLDLEQIKYYWFKIGKVKDVEMIVSRTGYTGEDGFELYFAPEYAEIIWDSILDAGKEYDIEPIGLGARDTLRLEMRYCLYGNDIDVDTTPLEAGLGWLVKFKKGEFIGKDTLLRQKEQGITRKLVGFRMIDKAIPRPGYPVLSDGNRISQVASGSFSPSLEVGIGTVYLPIELANEGTQFDVQVRNSLYKAEVVSTPFYKHGTRR